MQTNISSRDLRAEWQHFFCPWILSRAACVLNITMTCPYPTLHLPHSGTTTRRCYKTPHSAWSLGVADSDRFASLRRSRPAAFLCCCPTRGPCHSNRRSIGAKQWFGRTNDSCYKCQTSFGPSRPARYLRCGSSRRFCGIGTSAPSRRLFLRRSRWVSSVSEWRVYVQWVLFYLLQFVSLNFIASLQVKEKGETLRETFPIIHPWPYNKDSLTLAFFTVTGTGRVVYAFPNRGASGTPTTL